MVEVEWKVGLTVFYGFEYAYDLLHGLILGFNSVQSVLDRK